MLNSFDTGIANIIGLTADPQDGLLYAAGCCGNELSKIDPDTGEVIGSLLVEPTGMQGLSIHDGMLYASSNDNWQFYEIDLLSGETVRSRNVEDEVLSAFGGTGGINVNSIEVFSQYIFLNIDRGGAVFELHQFSQSDLSYVGLSYFGLGSDASAYDGEFFWVEGNIGTGGALIKLAPLPLSDTDNDGIGDPLDNCIVAMNPAQRDTDSDGIGNSCDADFDQNCIVNFVDLNIMSAFFFLAGDFNTDLNGDGLTNFADLSIMAASFFLQPGPSGVANDCQP